MKPLDTRMGSISFINSLPIDYALLRHKIPTRFSFIREIPAVLNTMMDEGELNFSPVSSLHFAADPDRYMLFPDLSVSSESGVGSVLLISRYEMADLSGKTIYITHMGKSTPALLQILLKKKYRVDAFMSRHRKPWEAFVDRECDAVLIIGDDALVARHEIASSKIRVIDLAQEWREWTNEPFVFAVWAVQKNIAEQYPKETQELWNALQESKRWGESHLDEIIAEARIATRLSEKHLKGYFDHLRFDLDEPLKRGLNLYVEYARGVGGIPMINDLDLQRRFLDVGVAC